MASRAPSCSSSRTARTPRSTRTSRPSTRRPWPSSAATPAEAPAPAPKAIRLRKRRQLACYLGPARVIGLAELPDLGGGALAGAPPPLGPLRRRGGDRGRHE